IVGPLDISGAGSRVDASVAIQLQFWDASCIDGGRITTSQLTHQHGSLVLGVDLDPTPVITASESALLQSKLVVQAGRDIPPAGSVRPPISSPALFAAFESIEIPTVNGYPLLYRATTTEATVKFTDHVDAFEVLAPAALVVGYAANTSAVA